MNVPSLGNLSHGGSFQLGTSHGSLDNHSIKNKERNSFKASVNSHQTSCKNHNNKKAKYIQVGVENSLEQKISHYYCSECAVEAALKDGYVQKLETSTSRLHTEESKGSKEGHEGQGEVMKASKSSRKVEGKSENQYNKDRSATREVEVRGFIQKIQENLKKVPVLESKFLKEKNQLQTNLKTINEKIQEFTAKVVKVLQEQTEEMLTNLNVEFGREMIRLSSFSEKLKNTNKGLQEISTDIESNYKRILHNIDEKPYRMIMDKYMERLPSFEKFFYNAKNFHMDYTKFLPTEKIAHFKRILKTFMNEAFAGYTTDIEACNSRLSHNSRLNKEALSSPPMHEFKTGEFEVFLRSEESEDVRGTKPNNPNNTNNTINTTNTINTNTINTFSTNHMLVSFENKDIFQNALQNSIEPITTTNFTRDSQSNTITSNVFVSDPEEFGNPLFLEALKTPKLNFEIEAALNEEVSSFTEDDFSSYREKDSSISSQTMSGSSSLNKYMSLLEKVNQKQDTRSQYLKSGRVYENGKKPSQVYDHVNLMNYIENKLKDENMREPCQKSLFQSPAFKEMDEDDGMLSY